MLCSCLADMISILSLGYSLVKDMARRYRAIIMLTREPKVSGLGHDNPYKRELLTFWNSKNKGGELRFLITSAICHTK